MADTTTNEAKSDEEIIAEELAFWERVTPKNEVQRKMLEFKLAQLRKGIVPLRDEEWDDYLDNMKGRA